MILYIGIEGGGTTTRVFIQHEGEEPKYFEFPISLKVRNGDFASPAEKLRKIIMQASIGFTPSQTYVRAAIAIGGGRDNYILGGTLFDYNPINPSYDTVPGPNNVIAGGDSNRILGGYCSIGGGLQNTINSYASFATIPGGDSLVAMADYQTVIGAYNITSDFFGGDNAEFIMGNGTAGNRSDGFTASYDGHITAFDINGDTHVGGGRLPVIGATYNDNTIIAWGEVASDGTLIADFGVQLVKEGTGMNNGSYFVVLEPQTSAGTGTLYNIANASITVTVEENDTSGMASFGDPFTGHPVMLLNPDDTTLEAGACAEADATKIGLFTPPYQNAFIVHIRQGAAAECAQQAHAFFFKVCAR